MKPVEIRKNVYWVGALDPQLRLFDAMVLAEHGTTYNAYLVKGESKSALIDLVKEKFTDEFLSNLESLINLTEIDYVVVNHSEPDHSGALSRTLEKATNAKVVLSRPCEPFVRNLLNRDIAPLKVGDGDSLDLGGRTLRFISAPFLHWPDTMFTYLPEERVLFSCDFLSAHYCDDRLFEDAVDDFSYAHKHYFDHIMRPFKEHALKALDKIQDLPIDLIATSHGPILNSNPRKYMDLCREWSRLPEKGVEKTLLIFYASAYGNTAKMAEEIALGARSRGVKVSLFDLVGTDVPSVLDKIEAADGIAVGSATVNGDALKPVWNLLSSLATVKVKGKAAAAFGSFGWSGEAAKFVEQRLEGLRFKLVGEPLTVKLAPTDEDLARCREFGQQLADALSR